MITIRFPKAIGILEATWTCIDHGVPTGPIVYGTEGTLVVNSMGYGGPSLRVIKERGAEGTVYEGDPLPEGRATLAEECIHHLETGEPLHPTLEMDFNLEAMAILDAGIRSAASGKMELLNDASWCIG